MPVTVQIEDRVKKTAGATPPAELGDYVEPSERGEGLKALLIWLLSILVVSAVLSIAEGSRPFGIGVFVWWLVSVFAYFIVAPRLVLRRLRMHGAEYEITAKKYPRLKTLLSKASTLLGVSEPESFLASEGVSQVRLMGRKDPYFLVITQATCELLQGPELDCLVLRSLVQARQGHGARLMLLQFLNDTPSAVRLLVWPVALYGFLLRTFWLDLAERTADRISLLLIKNPKLLTSALLKQHVATDPIMQANDITARDVDNFIRQEGNIGMAGTEISTQYKMGSAIHENPYLEDRLQAISNWAKSPEFTEALKKLAETKAGKTPTGTFSATDVAATSSPQST
ncbi:MAG: hypothetical protein JWN98_2748 [Abditibacteriota bacterium]|nr:hypothetical protein [Abditibacteriota bacterium]